MAARGAESTAAAAAPRAALGGGRAIVGLSGCGMGGIKLRTLSSGVSGPDRSGSSYDSSVGSRRSLWPRLHPRRRCCHVHHHPHPPHCIAQAPAPRPLCHAFESPTVAVHVYKVAAPVPSSASCANDEWSDSWWMVGGGWWVDGEAAWLQGSQPRKTFCHSLSVKVFAHKPTFSPNQFQANLSGAPPRLPLHRL